MMKNIFTFLAIFLIPIYLFSQTPVITQFNFESSQCLNSSSCNIFLNNHNLCTSYEFYTSHGAVNYETKNSVRYINLKASSYLGSDSSKASSGFYITYPFKKNYKYLISAVVWGQPDKPFPLVNLKFAMYVANNVPQKMVGADSCNLGRNPNVNDKRLIYKLENFAPVDSTKEKTISFGYAGMEKDYSQLWLNAYGGNDISARQGKFYIRSITIYELSQEFVVSPNTLSIPCGESKTYRFSVNNPNNIAGSKSYVWNLGSNNGWYYNGATAPAIITTTENYIDLTSTILPKSFTVTPIVNSVAYKDYNISVINASPNYSVLSVNGTSGTNNNFVCQNAVFKLNYLPLGSTVQWSFSPQGSGGVPLLSSAADSVIVTKQGDVSGILTATVQGNCIGSANKNIILGNDPSALSKTYQYSSNTYTVSSVNTVPANAIVDAHFYFPGATSITSKIYSGTPYSNTVIGGEYIQFVLGVIGSPTSSVQFEIVVKGAPCGDIIYRPVFYVRPGSFGLSSKSIESAYILYPNPATDKIIIKSSNSADDNKKIYAIKVFNKTGKLLIEQEYNNGKNEVSLNIKNLLPETYIININKGENIVKKQFIKN